MITPALVAAESHPNALARSAGGMLSATYACTTPVVPPPSPCTNRERKSSQSEWANPNATYANAELASPTSSAGRRPYRSETCPHTGDEKSWAIGNDAAR